MSIVTQGYGGATIIIQGYGPSTSTPPADSVGRTVFLSTGTASTTDRPVDPARSTGVAR